MHANTQGLPVPTPLHASRGTQAVTLLGAIPGFNTYTHIEPAKWPLRPCLHDLRRPLPLVHITAFALSYHACYTCLIPFLYRACPKSCPVLHPIALLPYLPVPTQRCCWQQSSCTMLNSPEAFYICLLMSALVWERLGGAPSPAPCFRHSRLIAVQQITLWHRGCDWRLSKHDWPHVLKHPAAAVGADLCGQDPVPQMDVEAPAQRTESHPGFGALLHDGGPGGCQQVLMVDSYAIPALHQHSQRCCHTGAQAAPASTECYTCIECCTPSFITRSHPMCRTLAITYSVAWRSLTDLSFQVHRARHASSSETALDTCARSTKQSLAATGCQ